MKQLFDIMPGVSVVAGGVTIRGISGGTHQQGNGPKVMRVTIEVESPDVPELAQGAETAGAPQQ